MKALIFNKRKPHTSENAPEALWMSQNNEVLHFLTKEVFTPGMILLPNGLEFSTTGYEVMEILQQEPQGKKWQSAIQNYEPFLCSVRVETIDLSPYTRLIKKHNKQLREFDITIQPVGIQLVDIFEAYHQSETVPA